MKKLMLRTVEVHPGSKGLRLGFVDEHNQDDEIYIMLNENQSDKIMDWKKSGRSYRNPAHLDNQRVSLRIHNAMRESHKSWAQVTSDNYKRLHKMQRAVENLNFSENGCECCEANKVFVEPYLINVYDNVDYADGINDEQKTEEKET